MDKISEIISSAVQVKATDVLEVFGSMPLTTDEKIYLAELLVNKSIGKAVAVDDRKVPFEKIIEALSGIKNQSIYKYFNSELVSMFWSDLEHPTREWPGQCFRSADGSNNSHLYPHMGVSNSSYARSVKSTFKDRPIPDAGELFKDLMKRTSSFEPHPQNFSSLLFGLAGTITHDLFNSDPKNPAINRTTHYLDLSPLYGNNSEEQKAVRAEGGRLKPDAFSDERLQFQMPTIVVFTILFSRNHNFIVDQISDKLGGDDETIFQTARLINCACYLRLIVSEYLTSILGIKNKHVFDPLVDPPSPNPTSGSVVSIEFSYIYRWHSAISKHDENWLEKYHINENFLKMKEKSIAEILVGYGYTEKERSLGKVCLGLNRDDQTGLFKNSEIINVLRESMTNVASKMGARKVPAELEAVEIKGIIAARKNGVCTLNEFRKFFHLDTYESFESMVGKDSPDLVEILEKHYKNIDNVELYPGVLIEETKPDGLCLPYTAARAILSDAVNLLRNDRFYAEGINEHNLTKWGYDYSTSNFSFKEMIFNCFQWEDPLLESPFRVRS